LSIARTSGRTCRRRDGGGDRGERTHAGRGVEDQFAEREFVALERGFLEGLDGLGADFGVGVREQRDEATGGGGAGPATKRPGSDPSKPSRSDGRATAGEDAETQMPWTRSRALADLVAASKRSAASGRRVSSICARRRTRWSACAGARRGLGGGGLGDAAVDERGGGRDSFGLHHLAGFEGDEASRA
jgi:hypothetical protein